ncbi:MAG: glycosyltransferase family 4 protein [Lachnospiraceae bacterium]|nr:glycosyltransferase family 4 protein [Lachnospiraceae bacterium]
MEPKNKYRVLYVAPRYHTNQVPIVKGWLSNGHKVCFVSHYARRGEDYKCLNPVVLGYSKIFHLIFNLYKIFCNILKRKRGSNLYEFQLKLGFPPIGRASKIVEEFQPNFVILRERALYNIPFYKVCKKKNIPCILYNQSPLWDRPGRDSGLLRKSLLRFFPKRRITPVLGNPKSEAEKTENAFYLPFVMEPYVSWEEKKHFQKNQVRIISVGRYEPRKQMFLLLEVVKDLLAEYSLHLTFAGEVISDEQEIYYNCLLQKVKEYNLEKDIVLLRNLSREQMFAIYRESDLFVLPSTKERASVSQLEAMSCSMPVICSDTNGSACYVKSGINGYLFRDLDKDDLYEKLVCMIKNRKKLEEMGKNSYQLVLDEYQFKNYFDKLMEVIYGRAEWH